MVVGKSLNSGLLLLKKKKDDRIMLFGGERGKRERNCDWDWDPYC